MIPDEDDPSTLVSAVPAAASVQPPSVQRAGLWLGPREEPARYRLLEPVGSGSEGTVYRGEFVGRGEGTPIPVAVKILRQPPGAPGTWPLDGAWTEINDQIAVLAGLDSPHLVSIREAFLAALTPGEEPPSGSVDPRTPVIVMEWLDGDDPRRLVAAGALTPEAVPGWLRDLSDAVETLHSVSRTANNPLVHGDVKPSNCLVVPGRGLVLIDTGALQRAARDAGGRGMHTPSFAPPEVLNAPGRGRTAASDAYSVGAVAYTLLTGSPPPPADRPEYWDEARDAFVLRERALGGRASQRRNDRVRDQVLRLMDPQPQARLDGSGLSGWSAGLEELLLRRAARRRRSRVITGVVSVLVIALVGNGIWTYLTWDGRTTFEETRLADLPVFPAGGSLRYQTQFEDADGWHEGDVSGGRAEMVPGGYELAPAAGKVVVMGAPEISGRSDEIVTATGELSGGQGIWGVWCRGDQANPSDRYGFLISHTGSVAIETGAEALHWVRLTDLPLNAPVTVTGRCADIADGPELTLAVNGRRVRSEKPEKILGPGYSGLLAESFADVKGPVARATVSQFSVRTPER